MRSDTDDDADDAALRKRLAGELPRASDAHDDAILAAADSAARDIRARRRHRWLVPASLAASLLLAVGLFTLLPLPGERPDSLRGDPETPAVSPANGATLSELPSELSWPAVDGATSYSVEMRDATGAILGTHDAGTRNRVLMSNFPTAAFRPGTFFWTVRARGPALDRQLGPFTFALERVP